MGITGKMEIEIDIKSSGDVFHELFATKPHHVSNITADIHGCNIHEGEFGKVGSIVEWEYTLGGKKSVAKEIIERIDEENKIIVFKVIEGDLLNDFESMTATIHVIPSGEFDAIKWEINFVKKEDLGPYPTEILDFAIVVTRDIEAHHLNA